MNRIKIMGRIKRLAEFKKAAVFKTAAAFLLGVWQNASRLKRLLIISGALMLSAGLIFLGAALTLSQSELSLLVLRREFRQENSPCHENCRLARSERENLIVSALKDDAGESPSRLAGKIETYVLDESESISFRKELVKILRLAYGPDRAPDYLLSYLDAAEGDTDLKVAILDYFLPKESPRAAADYYFSLLSGEADLALKKAAALSLSDLKDKPANFNSGQLASIRNLVLAPETDRRLRATLIMLLADYYPLFKSQTVLVLKSVYDAKNLNDKVSQAFAADIINRGAAGGKLALPAISSQEWSDYYNN